LHSKSHIFVLSFALVFVAEAVGRAQSPPPAQPPPAEEPPAAEAPPPPPVAEPVAEAPAVAETTATSADKDELIPIVVVNVGARTPRTNVETTVPVDVVTASDIAHVGKTETGRILTTLAPSFISTPQTVADGTDHVDPGRGRAGSPDRRDRCRRRQSAAWR